MPWSGRSLCGGCHYCWNSCSLITAQKMKFSIKNFFSKPDLSHLLKNSLMENFIFHAVVSAQVYILLRACLRLAIVGTFGNRFNLTVFLVNLFYIYKYWICVFYALTSKWNYTDCTLSHFLTYFCVDNQKVQVFSELITNTPEKCGKNIGKLAKTRDFFLVSLVFYLEQFRNIMLRSLVLFEFSFVSPLRFLGNNCFKSTNKMSDYGVAALSFLLSFQFEKA